MILCIAYPVSKARADFIFSNSVVLTCTIEI